MPSPQHRREARAPSCTQCGAPLNIDWSARKVTCRACSASHVVSDAWRSQAAWHVASVATATARELRARWTAGILEETRAASGALVGGILGSASAFTGAFLAFSITRQRTFDLSLIYFAPLTLLWVVSLFAVTRSFARMCRARSLDEIRTMRMHTCSGCGGLTGVRAGQPVAKCNHCGSHLLTSADLAQSMVAELNARANEAAIHTDIAQRRFNNTRRNVTPIVVILTVVVMLGIPVIAILGDKGPSIPTGFLALSFGLPFAGAIWWWIRMFKIAGRVSLLSTELLTSLEQRAEAARHQIGARA